MTGAVFRLSRGYITSRLRYDALSAVAPNVIPGRFPCGDLCYPPLDAADGPEQVRPVLPEGAPEGREMPTHGLRGLFKLLSCFSSQKYRVTHQDG